MRKVDFFGARISEINETDQIQAIFQWVKEDHPSYITYSNVHVVVTARQDPRLRKAINEADIASPDGMPLIWVSRWKGYHRISKCSGPDMMVRVIAESISKGYRHYFYGSTDETLLQLVKVLEVKYPGIQVAGAFSPPFRTMLPAENDAVLEEINRLSPDFIWIGLGAPKQEIWMNENCPRLNRGILFGVGAAFDFMAGNKKRAPKWMQTMGLEWLYRLLSEPKRLWKRYLVTNTLFLIFLLQEQIMRLFRRK